MFGISAVPGDKKGKNYEYKFMLTNNFSKLII